MSNKCTRAFVFVEGVGNDICCPFVDQEENLFFLLQDCGEVIAIDPSGETERIHGTNGQPSGATFDEQGILYISDFAHGAVLAINEAGNDQQELVVGVYEDVPLKGPHSIVAGKFLSSMLAWSYFPCFHLLCLFDSFFSLCLCFLCQITHFDFLVLLENVC